MRRDVFTADVFVYQALTPPRCNVRLPCHASLRIRLVCLCNPESLASCVCNVTSSNSCLIQKKGDFAHLRERSGTFFRTPGGSLWKLEAITLHVCKWARIWVFIGAGHLRENSLSYSDLSSLLRNLWRGNRGLVSMAKQADRFHLEVCDLWGLWSPWTYMYMGNESPPPKKNPCAGSYAGTSLHQCSERILEWKEQMLETKASSTWRILARKTFQMTFVSLLRQLTFLP